MSEFQKRILRPLSLPIFAALFIGVLVISLSRVLLAVPEASSTIIALMVSAEVLGIAAVLASTTQRTKPAQRALLLVLALLLLGGGIASAKMGVRKEELAVGVPVPLTAKGTAFTTTTLNFPADTKVSLQFHNDDVATQHNVAIYSDNTLATNLFKGALVTGPASIPYAVEPLKAGTYFFQCDVHPQQMKGKVVVAEGPPGGEQPPPTSTAPPPPAGEASTASTVTASGLKFSVASFTLKADVPVSITLDNKDAGIPHNLQIFDREGGTLIEKGVDPFNGPAKQTWNFQAPKPGTYFFNCFVHPTMKGQVIFQ